MADTIHFPEIAWQPLLPFLIVGATALLVLLLGIADFTRKHLTLLALTLAGLAAAWGATLSSFTTTLEGFGGMLLLDPFARNFFLLFFAAAGLSALVAFRYIEARSPDIGEFYALLLFALLGMMFMLATRDLLVFFIGLEVMSIAVYVLAGFVRTGRRPAEAAIKYFLLGAFASGFILYGIAFIYGATGATKIEVLRAALLGKGQLATFGLMPLGMALLLFGFCFKIAAFPFHAWVPDVYEGAPSPVTGFMSVAVKAAAFAVFARIFVEGFLPAVGSWGPLIAGIAVLTMTFGNIVAIVQRSVKRMLAYSSIAHAGYLLVAISALQGRGTAHAANTSLIFYLWAYLFMNLGAFAVVTVVARKDEEGEEIGAFRGLADRSPLLALVMTLFLVSLAGIPPTAGFTAKLYLFGTAIEAKLYPLVILGVLNSVISVYYYLRVVVEMYMREPKEGASRPSVNGTLFVALLLCAWATLHLGIFSQGFLRFAGISASLPGMQ